MSKDASKKSSKRAKRGAKKGSPRADRSKRLLDLVMLLLRARAPVTFREIRAQFLSYQTANIEAGLRAFERDKADLLELGVPVRYITPDEDSSVEDGGYVVELKKYRLPEVHLTTDEISALVLATSVARAVPGNSHARICDLALRKLAFDYPEPDTPLAWHPGQGARGGGERAVHEPLLVHFPEGKSEAELELSDRFAMLEGATRRRKRVTLNYKSASNGQEQKRDLDPYGLFYRDKSWLVVGHCHLRGDSRSFRLDRISDLSVAPRPKSADFERPADFDVRAYASRSPWTFTPKPTEMVQLELQAEALSAANEDFGAEAVRDDVEGDDELRVRIRFETGNPDFVVSRILASKGAMKLLEGEQCKALLLEELAAIEAIYA
ncbi:MAG: WYL domain-containing protein [Myxococcales bacterium]|nr:WYL domain-containing protein [Myxococcales bacterium]